jgi:chromosome segregation ATPase
MNTPPLLLVGGFLAAGVVGGLTVHLTTPGPHAEAADSVDDVVLPSSAGPTSDVAGLSQRLDSLLARIELLETAGSLSVRTPTGDLTETLLTEKQLQEAVAAVMAKGPDQGAVRSMITSTLDDIQAQEELEREMEREQRRLDQLQARVDRLTEQLALYPDQAAAVYDIWADRDAKRDTIREDMRNGTADFTNMRETFRSLDEEMNTALQGVFTAEQYTKYTEENLGSTGRGGFGGGGARGGGFGG